MLTTDVFVELHVPDFEKVKEFYGKLGFAVVWEQEPEGREGYLVMRRGNEEVYDQAYFRRFPNGTVRGFGVEIVVQVDGIEAYYSDIERELGAAIVEPLQLRHSHPDFRMVDPFGYYLRFVGRHDWVNGRDENGFVIKR